MHPARARPSVCGGQCGAGATTTLPSHHICLPASPRPAPSRQRLRLRTTRTPAPCASSKEDNGASTSTVTDLDLEKGLTKLTRQTAATFAPRSSTAKGKNPAVKGSVLYNVFEVQAWITLVAGGLLSFNVIYPTDEPSIARLMGMWSLWMFTVPSLRAKECMPREKDALNVLFVLMPLMNVVLPFVWKSFPFIFTADVVALVAVYYWKGAWAEVYGIPFAAPAALEAVQAAEVAAAAAAAAGGQEQAESSQ